LLFKRLILTCQSQLQKERSISAVYYLLRGKQSIQTIQDAQLYQLSSYYGIYKQLSKDEFFDHIDELVSLQLLYPDSKDNFYIVSKKAEELLNNQPLKLYINGMLYKQFDQIFFQRLLLLLQVWTNSKRKNFTYIPIVENLDIANWVKTYYRLSKHDIKKYLQTLYGELFNIFLSLPTTFPKIFLDQFSGYQSIGLTDNQIAIKFNRSVEEIHIITTSIIHILLRKVKENPNRYKILYSVGEDLFSANRLTTSADKTRRLLDNGLSLDQIAAKRRLKLNTIFDHIVEIALHDIRFQLEAYVPIETQKQIVQTIKKIDSYKLSEIKAAVDKEITYFQIRLVLAKLNDFVYGSEVNGCSR